MTTQNPQPQPDRNPLIDYTTAAQMLGIAVGTLYAWVHHRRIPFVRLGKRCVRFDRNALTAWLASCAVEPAVKQ